MLKPTEAYSIVLRNEDAARRLEAEAQALEWPLEQLRRGQSLPPASLINVLEAHQQSCRATAGALLLSSTLIAEARRPAALSWWRRALAWLKPAGTARGTRS